LSRILRNIIEAPSIQVGEKHLDYAREKNSQERLRAMFPIVSVITDADGAKFIPIQEVQNLESILNEEKRKSEENGYQRGYEAGLQSGLAEAKKVIKSFDRAINDAVTQRELLFSEAREKVLELVIKISKKVTFDAVEADPEVTLKMINGVIDSLVDRSSLKIKVHPQHLPVLEQNIDKFLKESTSIKNITIEADPRVIVGGCFIETPTGDIDARLNSQFEVIKDVLIAEEEEG